MRVLVTAALLALSLAGCSAGVSSTDAVPSGSPAPTSTGVPSMASPGATPASGSATPAATAGPTAWTMVGAGLTRSGAQDALAAAREGSTVVASVLTEDTPDDYDAAIVYSLDGGATWAWGGVAASPGRTFPEDVILVDGTAVVVGSTQSGTGATSDSAAFLAVATAPDFALAEKTLPASFDVPGVRLHSIVSVDGSWVVAGYGTGASATEPVSYLWRSDDQGASWDRQQVTIPALTGLAVKQLVIAPDGSWNLVGDGTTGDKIQQFDAVWLRSTDQGRTFTQVSPKAFAAPFDQGASSISFSAEGKAAIVGSEEVTDEHGASVSALWISVPGHGVKRLGNPRVAVKDETPPGEFLFGTVWDDESLVAWGSTTEDYPMSQVQFWTVDSAQLVPTSVLAGDGTPLVVEAILADGDPWLAFGFSGQLDQADVGVWSGAGK
jgi:hypothetical protein